MNGTPCEACGMPAGMNQQQIEADNNRISDNLIQLAYDIRRGSIKASDTRARGRRALSDIITVVGI